MSVNYISKESIKINNHEYEIRHVSESDVIIYVKVPSSNPVHTEGYYWDANISNEEVSQVILAAYLRNLDTEKDWLEENTREENALVGHELW